MPAQSPFGQMRPITYDMFWDGPRQPQEGTGTSTDALIQRTLGLLKQFGPKEEPSNKLSDIDKQLASMKADRDRLMELIEQRRGGSDATMKASASAAPPTDMDSYYGRVGNFESGNNLDATNPGSGASGLFQFLPSTWKWIMREAPNLALTDEGIRDEKQQRRAMQYYTDKSAGILSPMLGRKPTGGELYLLHLLGHGGGPEVLRRLDEPLTATISGPAYKGNPFLAQYKTGHDLIAGLNQKFGG